MSAVSWASVPRPAMLTSGTSTMARIADVLLSVLLVRVRPGGGRGSEWNLEGVEVGGSSTLLGPEGSSFDLLVGPSSPRTAGVLVMRVSVSADRVVGPPVT
jgi:hypothetical protein